VGLEAPASALVAGALPELPAALAPPLALVDAVLPAAPVVAVRMFPGAVTAGFVLSAVAPALVAAADGCIESVWLDCPEASLAGASLLQPATTHIRMPQHNERFMRPTVPGARACRDSRLRTRFHSK